jgi:hypothetical protein
MLPHLAQPGIIVSDSDPGAIGAGRLWLDTSGDTPVLKVRNDANDGWQALSGGAATYDG